MKKYITTGILTGICLVLLVLELLKPLERPEPWGWGATVERILIDAGVEDVEGCLRWAYGEDYKRREQRELDDVWRQRHSDLFIIRGSDDIVESTKRIAKAWLDTKPKMYDALYGDANEWELI